MLLKRQLQVSRYTAGMAVKHRLSLTIGTLSTFAVSNNIDFPIAAVVFLLNFLDNIAMSLAVDVRQQYRLRNGSAIK